MPKYIKKKALKSAIECCTWYHIGKGGELVEGANSYEHEPLYKYSDIKEIIKNLPTRKFETEPKRTALSKALKWTYGDEPSDSEKPNNCEHITEDGVTCAKYPACDDCLDNPLNKVKGSERLVKSSEQTEPTISKMEQVDKPTTQTETQNSNLTFEKRTIDYCDVCNHKGCDNCIADGNNPYCVPSQFEPKDEPQTEQCKLINAVVRLDMSREDKFKVIELIGQHCESCKHYLFTDVDGYYCEHETYGQPCDYEPKDEPQTDCAWK